MMVFNYIKIAWRNLLRNTWFSFVNIFGLATGLTGFILLLLYLNYEKSYDTWHPDLDRVYKVGMENAEGIMWNGKTQAPLASFISGNSPKIEAATRISGTGNADFEVLLEANGKKIYQKGFIEADSAFFGVFPFEFIYGSAVSALEAPDGLVLDEDLASSYFGSTNPIGQPVSLFGGIVQRTVTGVIRSPSTPSALNARILTRSPYEKSNQHWQNFSYNTFVRLQKSASAERLADDINELYRQHHVKGGGESADDKKDTGLSYFTEKLGELHNSPRSGESNLPTIRVLLILASALLIAGAVNFSNLSLAEAFRRTGEVGVRKVLGSGRLQLFVQFLADVGLQVLGALAMSAVLVTVLLPWFREQFGVSLSFFQPGVALFYLQGLLCLLCVIVIAGIYPALYLSGLSPVHALKGAPSIGMKAGFPLRKSFIVIQFVLSGFFIISSFVISRQMDFLQRADKGFTGDQVLRIQATQSTRDQDFEKTRQRLLRIPGVMEVGKTTTVPGDVHIDTSFAEVRWRDVVLKMNEVKVSREYFGVIGATLLDGRWFDERYADQHTRSAIINEAAAKRMQIENPVGQIVRFPYCDTVQVEIVGIVKDFNVQGLNVPVQPAIFDIGNFACSFRSGGALLVKIDAGRTQETLAEIEQAWKGVEPELPVRYGFLDENFKKLYAGYLRVQQVVAYFTAVAILIAIVGLFALSVYLVRAKKRELGIRKVLGAGMRDIFKVTSLGFLQKVALAMVIATPIGWIAAEKWLENFASRIEIEWWFFALAGLIVVSIAVLTVGMQAIQAAVANPVKSLRSE